MTNGYFAEGLVMALLGGQVIESDDIGVYAIELAHRKWPVFPLRGKDPYGSCGQCKNPVTRAPLHPSGQCPHGPELPCHGLLDASSDYRLVNHWWTGRWRGSNIGMRLIKSVFVIDIDPRAGGHERLTEHEARHGKLPVTLRVYSGRGDGGE